MATDNYDGNTLSDLIDTHPEDTDFVGTAAPAIRQVKRFLHNTGTGGVFDVIFRWTCERLFPVGAYYITEDSSNPGERFGGTWVKVKGKFLLGSSEVTDADVYNVGDEGGEKEHTLTTSELPTHSHSLGYQVIGYGHGGGVVGERYLHTNEPHTDTSAVGADQPHNNMPPYRVVNIWRKVSNE